jgi:hypothetical protein
MASGIPEHQQWWQVTADGVLRSHRNPKNSAMCSGARTIPFGPTKVFFEACLECPTIIPCTAASKCAREGQSVDCVPDEQPGLFA